jgi:signal peptidase I
MVMHLGSAVGGLLLQIVLSWCILAAVMRTTFVRAILVWLVTAIPAVVAVAVVFLVLRPYVTEAFIVPANSMAPTVVGWHTEGVCPECQGLLIVPAVPPEERDQFRVEPDQLGICAVCKKTSSVKAADTAVQQPDRILINKLLKPQRWDMIVLRYPEKPSIKYVKRLVGLPGETVYIKDGAVWINQVKAELPAALTGLTYTTTLERGFPVQTATPDNPLRLGEEEYCVLGDFSRRSADSRSWGTVPGSHIEGVVSLCYWPISRWKIHR